MVICVNGIKHVSHSAWYLVYSKCSISIRISTMQGVQGRGEGLRGDEAMHGGMGFGLRPRVTFRSGMKGGV